MPLGFEPVSAVQRLLSGLTVPWWVTGGWAMDLTAGRTTRPHADVDVMILERDEHALRTDLADVELTLVSGPKNEEQPWPAGRRLIAGPDRIRIDSPRLPMRTEVVIGAAIRDMWVYHRGRFPRIGLTFDRFTKERFGVPFTAPEIVLAMKCMWTRENDESDFRTILPFLDAEQRQWLVDAVSRRWEAGRGHGDVSMDAVEHPWLELLRAKRNP